MRNKHAFIVLSFLACLNFSWEQLFYIIYHVRHDHLRNEERFILITMLSYILWNIVVK